jgi:ribose transport system substrate-binding protein
MRISKSLVGAAAVTAAVLATAACGGGTVSESPNPGSGGGTATGGGSGQQYVAMVSKGFQHQFWQAVKQGAEDKAKELNVKVTFDGPASETMVDQQLQMVQEAIDKKPNALAYAALDPQACVPLMNAAKTAKIPVVQFDAGCDGSDYPLNISKTDSKKAGALAADHMASLIGDSGEVAVIGHSQINSTGVERRDGFLDEMKAKHSNIKVVDVQYGDGDHLKSADIAKAMIAAHPGLKGLYGTNEGSAIGIVDAAQELNLSAGKITIVGFDSGKAQIDAIKSGLMAGAITQDPIGIGKSTVQSAVDAIAGKQLQKVIDTGSYWYDKTNIDDPKIAAVLYQ